MTIRPALRPVLFGGAAVIICVVAGMMAYCLSHRVQAIHLATLALLTTSGALVSRIFEGLAQRRQRRSGLDMQCVAADDELLFARSVPLVVPIAGALFSYYIMM
ncbi:hypothetical protein [Amaricoccus sp.]|uniref:hypothetical protein n=1 Tax=Amaricoccus sp. TaxID=1872485 RepID=UPI00260F744C|nr:hypothetical protein [uncultured Amaricoccus sp.]